MKALLRWISSLFVGIFLVSPQVRGQEVKPYDPSVLSILRELGESFLKQALPSQDAIEKYKKEDGTHSSTLAMESKMQLDKVRSALERLFKRNPEFKTQLAGFQDLITSGPNASIVAMKKWFQKFNAEFTHAFVLEYPNGEIKNLHFTCMPNEEKKLDWTYGSGDLDRSLWMRLDPRVDGEAVATWIQIKIDDTYGRVLIHSLSVSDPTPKEALPDSSSSLTEGKWSSCIWVYGDKYSELTMTSGSEAREQQWRGLFPGIDDYSELAHFVLACRTDKVRLPMDITLPDESVFLDHPEMFLKSRRNIEELVKAAKKAEEPK